MSRIFEALRQAEIVSETQDIVKPREADSAEFAERRRGRRWSLDIPVYVYGHGPAKEPFHEEAHTLHVNANGALLLLSVPVREGQKLLLTNTLTEAEQHCWVVYLGTRRSRTIEAGVAFPETNRGFWQIPASPEDKPAA